MRKKNIGKVLAQGAIPNYLLRLSQLPTTWQSFGGRAHGRGGRVVLKSHGLEDHERPCYAVSKHENPSEKQHF